MTAASVTPIRVASTPKAPTKAHAKALNEYNHLRTNVRLAWVTLTLGIALSMTANILAADPSIIAKAFNAIPPVALLLTSEMLMRASKPKNRLIGWGRLLAGVGVAGVAAWFSYWHIVEVAKLAGETAHGIPYLSAIVIDGLMLVASLTLIHDGPELTAARKKLARWQ